MSEAYCSVCKFIHLPSTGCPGYSAKYQFGCSHCATLRAKIAALEKEVKIWEEKAVAARLEGHKEHFRALKAEKELVRLRAFRRSVDEALNSGDGTYKP